MQIILDLRIANVVCADLPVCTLGFIAFATSKHRWYIRLFNLFTLLGCFT